MTAQLKDGTGSGNLAKVDEVNRLHTHSFDVPIGVSAALEGDFFNTSTGVINLTSTTSSSIFYLNNISAEDFIMVEQFLDTGGITGTITYSTNGTAGTLLDNEVAGFAVNRRLTDPTVLGATFYTGVEGDTLTGGTEASFLTSGFNNNTVTIIPAGVSFGVKFTPPSGNTSMDITFGMNIIQSSGKYGGDLT